MNQGCSNESMELIQTKAASNDMELIWKRFLTSGISNAFMWVNEWFYYLQQVKQEIW